MITNVLLVIWDKARKILRDRYLSLILCNYFSLGALFIILDLVIKHVANGGFDSEFLLKEIIILCQKVFPEVLRLFLDLPCCVHHVKVGV